MIITPQTSDECLFFLHKPKTAGSSLRALLTRIYPAEQLFLAAGLADIARFIIKRQSEVNGYRLIGGHFPFGFHQPHIQQFRYFTFLREPIDRVASFYYYTSRSPQESDYLTIRNQQLSLSDYVCGLYNKENDNGMVRKISGVGTKLPYGQCTTALLDQAKENINQHFAFIGFQEQFDQDVKKLCETFQWPYSQPEKTNVTQNRPAVSALSQSTVDTLSENNQYDLALYQWAWQQFS